MGWKGHVYQIPGGMLYRKMYCKSCGTRLKIKKHTRLIKKGDKDFDIRMGMPGPINIGMSSYDSATYTYWCPSCRTEITYEEQRYVAKEQKRTNSRILRSPFSGNDNMFATQTKAKYARRPYYIILLLLLPVAAVLAKIIGQLYQNPNAETAAFISFIIMLAACLYNVIIKPPVFLNFYGTRLHVRDKYNVEFDIYSLTADDFLFKQNAIEKRKNIGHLRIRNSDYKFVGIENFAELVAYVKENF